MQFLNLIMIFFIGFSAYCSAAESLMIEDFKSLDNWRCNQCDEDKKIKESGFDKATESTPARMWFVGKKDTLDSYYWGWNWNGKKNGINVSEFDYLLISYKLSPDTRLTIIPYFDGDEIFPRPASYIKGNGEWEELRIPIKGKILTRLFISLSEHNTDKGEDKLYEAWFRSIRAVKSGMVPRKSIVIDYPLIIPHPKELIKIGKSVALIKNGKPEFMISIAGKESDLKNIIASEIAEGLKLSSVEILKPGKNVTIQLALGKEEAGNLSVPEKPEAYTIEFIEENGTWKIVLAANDKAGLYWAWQSLRQLIINDKDDISVTACNIKDWPDLRYRALTCNDLSDLKKNLSMKFNATNYPWWKAKGLLGESASSKKWENYKKDLKELCDYAVARGTDISLEFGPFYEKESISVSDDKQMHKLFEIYEYGLNLGCRTVILTIDDGGRNNLTEADKKAYNGDKFLCHAWFMKKLSDKILGKYPDTLVIINIMLYWTADGIAGYYDKIGVSPKVIALWPGAQTVTLDYSNEDIDKYEKGIEGRGYAMHDNTPGQCFGAYRGLTICEKYGNGYGNIAKRGKFIGTRAYVNSSNQVRHIKCLQVAEQLWNARNYDVERSRQQAIAKIAGNPSAIDPILNFADEYLKIAYKYPIDKRLRPESDFVLDKNAAPIIRIPLEKRDVSRFSIDDSEYSRLKEKMGEISRYLAQIEETSKNKMLTDEFKLYFRNMQEVIEHLYSKRSTLPVMSADGSLTFEIDKVPGGTHYEKRNNGKISCAIYGQQTPNPVLNARFRVEKVPDNDPVLLLEGQDCDKNIATIRVELNGNLIYEGQTPFVQNGWKSKEFKVSSKFFKTGVNDLRIENTCQTSDFIDHWALISEIIFKNSNKKE